MFDFDFDIDRRILAIGALALLITFGVGYKYGTYCEGKKQVLKQAAAAAVKPAAEPAPKVEEKQNNLLVYVFGEVKHPGIYQMKEGSRVFEVLDKAEPTPKADISQTNPATILTDQQNVQVPRVGQTIASSGVGNVLAAGKGSSSTANGIVNLNTATAAEIDQKLPGIGPTLAQRIIDYRQQSGGFKKIEDLKEVPGIGDRRFEQLKSQIRV
ncbi:MAG: helix-hairpin-helix domain-containing protein [Candidatus Saccharibacteria bacterium]